MWAVISRRCHISYSLSVCGNSIILHSHLDRINSYKMQLIKTVLTFLSTRMKRRCKRKCAVQMAPVMFTFGYFHAYIQQNIWERLLMCTVWAYQAPFLKPCGILKWINRRHCRHLFNLFSGVSQQLTAFKSYRTVEKPDKFKEKGNLEVLLHSIQSKMRANNQKPYTPKEGKLVSDINKVHTRSDAYIDFLLVHVISSLIYF